MTAPNPSYRALHSRLYDTCACGSTKQKQSKMCSPCALKNRGHVRPQLQQPDDPDTRLIALTQGKIAIVETCKYDELMQYKWAARKQRGGRYDAFYALRNEKDASGKRRIVFMHRVILGLEQDDPREGDHALHNTLDNRRFVDGKENLRIATDAEQSRNHRMVTKTKAGLKGVALEKKTGKWIGQITYKKQRIYLGLFATKELAHAAYCKAAEFYFGRFACVK